MKIQMRLYIIIGKIHFISKNGEMGFGYTWFLEMDVDVVEMT